MAATVTVPLISAPQVAAGASRQVVARIVPKGGIKPPKNPSKSLPPSPAFVSSSSCIGAKDDSACNTVVLKAIAHARSVLESMGGMRFNLTAYDKMTRPEQLFVTANLERQGRGIPTIYELTTSLDTLALAGAKLNRDPPFWAGGKALPGGGVWIQQGGNWAGGYDNPLGSDYGWMYDDGLGSPNGGCTKANPTECWAHRDNILGTYATLARCGGGKYETVMGAANTNTTLYKASEAQIFVGVCGPMPTDAVMTWSHAKLLLGLG
jgi:hypothetical protein